MHADVLISVVLVVCAFGLIFILCELGERLMEQFAKIDHEILKLDWYQFPTDIQKMLPTIMNGTQPPVMLRGISNILCTRETFKYVSHL